MVTFKGENPYYLLIVPDVQPDQPVTIDLDVHKWMRRYKKWLRTPGEWYLVSKADNGIPLSLRVFDGEQPYYVCRHVGIVGSGGGNEVRAYGIGKKRRDSIVERLWVLENGQICGGDDVEYFAGLLLAERGPR